MGDDALACLKDLKKWLRLYDEKNNRLDVARCLAEANLVEGDLLEILASWPETATEDRFKSKIALACMELLVPLTWPIEKNDTQMTINHHRHIPFLHQAQRSYKRAILEHDSGMILRTCVRTALPSIALPLGERSPRDEGIIKLLLYFCRNIAIISGSASDVKDESVSRSATIEAFRDQEVLALLLTIASNMGDDFSSQDVTILEILFHLLKGVNVEKLFMDKKQLADKSGDELKYLLSKEANMHRSYARNAPTRHNRFGTMIWVKRDEPGRNSTVTGQDVLKTGEQALSKMDQSKRWNRPRRQNKDEEPSNDRFDIDESLTEAARLHLRSFIEEFLDSSFNPLFNHIRRAIEREADRVLENHKQQYFYLISWFLEAERVRRRRKREAEKLKKSSKIEETFEPDSFALIASVLTQESLVLLNRFMQDRLDIKSWRELQAGMRCFTQVLLIVQDMAESAAEEDQEIAENIQNRIFYEETTHDRIVAILRGYKDQGFSYLDACTEMSHVFLRMLERYSREHVDLQIRSRRRARKKATPKEQDPSKENDEDDNSEKEDVREAERTTRERQFDFKRFSAKFSTQACVDAFVLFLKYYNDLDQEQLKRAHRFFYRIAFKQDVSVMLFRLDIIALFNKIIKGPENLDTKNPLFKEWEELIRQVLKRLFKKLDQRPQLVIELLFSKINSTAFFLENGYEKQTISKSKPPATLEVRGNFSDKEKIGVVVTILQEHDPSGLLEWIVNTIGSAADERQSWEAEAAARQESELNDSSDKQSQQEGISSKPPFISILSSNEPIRVAMFRDGKLRLLMQLCGFERLGIDDVIGATWIIPSSLTSQQLKEFEETIRHYQANPMNDFSDKGVESATELLRRKPLEASQRAEYDDDSDGSLGIVSDNEEEFLFPAGGPTNSVDKTQNALELLKKRHRKRNRRDDDRDLDEKEVAARRKAREQAELERRRKIKSEEFVRDSDEESDEDRDREFFSREAARRKAQGSKVMELLAAGRVSSTITGEKLKSTVESTTTKKRKAQRIEKEGERSKRWKGSSDFSDLSDDDDDMEIAHDLPGAAERPVRAVSEASHDSEDAEEGEDRDHSEDTPLSSPPFVQKNVGSGESDVVGGSPASSQVETRVMTAKLNLGDDGGGEEDEEEEDPVPVATSRRRARAVFDDSDDE